MELNQLILANTCAEVVTGADVAWYSSSHFLLKYVSFSQVTVRIAKPVFALKKKHLKIAQNKWYLPNVMP